MKTILSGGTSVPLPLGSTIQILGKPYIGAFFQEQRDIRMVVIRFGNVMSPVYEPAGNVLNNWYET